MLLNRNASEFLRKKHDGIYRIYLWHFVTLQTMAAENHSEQANEAEPDVPPAIPSRPEHTKSKVFTQYLS